MWGLTTSHKCGYSLFLTLFVEWIEIVFLKSKRFVQHTSLILQWFSWLPPDKYNERKNDQRDSYTCKELAAHVLKSNRLAQNSRGKMEVSWGKNSIDVIMSDNKKMNASTHE